MRIVELLEENFDDSNFVKQNSDKKELDYDLVEDLIHFMNHDDDVYRQHVYPSIVKCIHGIKSKTPTGPGIFKDAVIKSYDRYIVEFPIRELPQALSKKTFKEVCTKMHEEVCQHAKEGKYKD
jgi:hypothetical protein